MKKYHQKYRSLSQFHAQLAEIVPVYLQDAELYRDELDAHSEALRKDEEAAYRLAMDFES
jgi:hypothetical protein